jgi:uncharacterized protein with von Willebrand factor type A (vWA) domain
MNKQTEIILIIDKSGSMQGFENDTIGGYNAFIEEQQKLPGRANLTTVLFDTEITSFEERTNLQDAKKLERKDYFPMGSTALIDAIIKTVKQLEQRFEAQPLTKTDKVIIGVITDGQENASREFTKADLRKLIETKTEAGWSFRFLSADLDAISDAIQSYGVFQANTFLFAQNTQGYRSAYTDNLSGSVAAYRAQ